MLYKNAHRGKPPCEFLAVKLIVWSRKHLLDVETVPCSREYQRVESACDSVHLCSAKCVFTCVCVCVCVWTCTHTDACLACQVAHTTHNIAVVISSRKRGQVLPAAQCKGDVKISDGCMHCRIPTWKDRRKSNHTNKGHTHPKAVSIALDPNPKLMESPTMRAFGVLALRADGEAPHTARLWNCCTIPMITDLCGRSCGCCTTSATTAHLLVAIATKTVALAHQTSC